MTHERAGAGRVAELGGKRIGAPIDRPHQILCIGLNCTRSAGVAGPGDVMELGVDGLGKQRQQVAVAR